MAENKKYYDYTSLYPNKYKMQFQETIDAFKSVVAFARTYMQCEILVYVFFPLVKGKQEVIVKRVLTGEPLMCDCDRHYEPLVVSRLPVIQTSDGVYYFETVLCDELGCDGVIHMEIVYE